LQVDYMVDGLFEAASVSGVLIVVLTLGRDRPPDWPAVRLQRVAAL